MPDGYDVIANLTSAEKKQGLVGKLDYRSSVNGEKHPGVQV